MPPAPKPNSKAMFHRAYTEVTAPRNRTKLIVLVILFMIACFLVGLGISVGTQVVSFKSDPSDSTSGDLPSFPCDDNCVSSDPTDSPTDGPTDSPTDGPTEHSTEHPSETPTESSSPTEHPSETPTASSSPTELSSETPTNISSDSPTATDSPTNPFTFFPGSLTTNKLGITLSEGLDIRIISRISERVLLANGNLSEETFHKWPDAGACFAHPDGPENGYAYLSNSEATTGRSGVGAIYFDSNHNVIEYKKLLTGTTKNCGGGKTPWNTWITCEEHAEGTGIWQVHPWETRTAERTALGDLTGIGDSRAGMWESFSYDVRNSNDPKFFFTEDDRSGSIRRFTPSSDTITTDPDKMWDMLNDQNGTHEYLLLNPDSMTFEWSRDLNAGNQNAFANYGNCEGIDSRDGHLYVVSKLLKRLFDLNLDTGTYIATSTKSGTFSSPDQIKHLLSARRRELAEAIPGWMPERKTVVEGNGPILYGTEDGDATPGIFGMDTDGRWFTILEKLASEGYNDESTGLAFSPDHRHLFFCIQVHGICYTTWRKDGHPFDGLYLNLKHH